MSKKILISLALGAVTLLTTAQDAFAKRDVVVICPTAESLSVTSFDSQYRFKISANAFTGAKIATGFLSCHYTLEANVIEAFASLANKPYKTSTCSFSPTDINAKECSSHTPYKCKIYCGED